MQELDRSCGNGVLDPHHWPVDVDWGAGREEQLYYRMGDAIAEWWREARVNSSNESG